MPSATVLITGGAGFIGSHACKELDAAGYDLVVYDNLSTGHADFLRWGTFVHGDILDTARLAETLHASKACGVIHFASFINVGESVASPGKYYKNNFCGSLSVLEAMRMVGVRNLVVSGSAAVYGEPKNLPVTENAPLAPVSPYGASKAMMERLLDDYELAHGIHTASLRYFNAAGNDPELLTGERHTPETHLIPNVFRAIVGQTPALRLFGDDYPTPDGTCIRDYVHVNDLASAHRLALERLIAGGQSLKCNLGSGKGFSVKEILGKAEEITGRKAPYKVEGRRAGDPPALVASPDLAKELLGWKAEHSSLEHIISTAWEWFEQERAAKKNGAEEAREVNLP